MGPGRTGHNRRHSPKFVVSYAAVRTIVFRPEHPTSSSSQPLRVNKMGIREDMPPKTIHRPNGNNDYLFMLFHTPAAIKVAGSIQHHPGDTMMIWVPGQSHYYGNAKRRWDHSWFHCEGSAVRRRIDSTSLPLNTPFRLPEPAVVEKYLLAFHAEITSHLVPDTEIQCGLLSIWIREMERQVATGEAASLPERFVDVKRRIESHFHESLRLSDLAEIACMSVPYFCAGFKRYFGFSAIEYVVLLRMQHAAYLLGDVNMNVTAVAEAVGYRDIYYFSRLFKRHYGLSPRYYRRRLGGGAGALPRAR
jgi:AraC family transcriptional regulator, arabinose operon regulatory protein